MLKRPPQRRLDEPLFWVLNRVVDKANWGFLLSALSWEMGGSEGATSPGRVWV